MASSDRLDPAVMGKELRMFWQLSRRATELKAVDPDGDEMADTRDEMEVLAEMTDWPRLKLAIAAFLTMSLLPLEALAV